MDRVILERQESGDQGTFGRLIVGQLSLYTGELPWRGNASDTSCIPPGVYNCAMTLSPRFRRALYEIRSVDGRSAIRIHPANVMGDKSRGYLSQLNGCVALGERMGWMDRQKAVLLSRPAVRRFEMHMQHKPFLLEVRNA